MSTKSETLRDPQSGLNKASPHEPIFVLRAKDPHAAQTIRLWAAMSAENQPIEKIEQAFNVAADFEKWYHANVPEMSSTVAGAQQANYNPRIDTAPSAAVFLRKPSF